MGSRSFCRPVTPSAAINREPVREGGPGRDDPPRPDGHRCHEPGDHRCPIHPSDSTPV